MKKTDMMVCVGKKNGYDVYRTVFEKDGHFFVKWNNDTVNVDEEIENRKFVHKSNY